jgi:hypothetical protein
VTEPRASEGEITRRLDRVIAILQLAYREQIDATRNEIQADQVNAAILELVATDWVPAGTIKESVMGSTEQGSRTIERRLAKLAAMGVIEQDGTGSRIRYRSSGVL